MKDSVCESIGEAVKDEELRKLQSRLDWEVNYYLEEQHKYAEAMKEVVSGTTASTWLTSSSRRVVANVLRDNLSWVIDGRTTVRDAIKVLDDMCDHALSEGCRVNASTNALVNVVSSAIAEAWVDLWKSSFDGLRKQLVELQ